MNRPNIVFYFSDQQRYDTVVPDIMPNLCRLAENGVVFDNNFTCQPVCGPARSCLQSGMYATQTGCFRNAISLPLNIKPLASYFNDAGYSTAYIGKWHLASDSVAGKGFHCEKTAVPVDRQGEYKYWRASDVLESTSHGYDGYVFDEKGNKLNFTGYRADAINDFALEFLQNRNKSVPFFMFISFLEPHHQNDHGCFEGYRETVDNYKDYPLPEDLTFLSGDYKKSYPDYLSAINRLDYNLGRLTDKLKEQGVFDNTIIIYTSDHGCHFKTRNLEYKRTCHENTVKTPLVIFGPGFSGGKHISTLSSIIDLPVTMLSGAGIEVPECFMGEDLNTAVKTDKAVRDSVLIQISESQIGRAIRTPDYKYSMRSASPEGYLRGSAKVYFDDYLYDIKNDPYEKCNLIKSPDYNDVRKNLHSIIKREMLKSGEKEPIILPALIKRKK